MARVLQRSLTHEAFNANDYAINKHEAMGMRELQQIDVYCIVNDRDGGEGNCYIAVVISQYTKGIHCHLLHSAFSLCVRTQVPLITFSRQLPDKFKF